MGFAVGHPMRLAISPSHMEKLSPAEKLALRDFSLQHNTALVAGPIPQRLPVG